MYRYSKAVTDACVAAYGARDTKLYTVRERVAVRMHVVLHDDHIVDHRSIISLIDR